jgi:transcriptional regulator with XRE-family HTH domain
MRPKRFSDQIRAAVDASGLSRYSICKAIGFNQGAMSRFMSGKGGLSTEMLDRLAELLGLNVVMKPRKRADDTEVG